MALPQDISPVNPNLMDTLIRGHEVDWIPLGADGDAFIKILWTGSETGRWAALFKWAKGYVAAPHKHLSAAHTFVLSGKIQVRDDVLEAGDYIYERNGMVHGETKALEDSEYLFICDGPVLFYNDDGFTSYLGWEQLERLQTEYQKTKAA